MIHLCEQILKDFLNLGKIIRIFSVGKELNIGYSVIREDPLSVVH
jgi:hypothetical protein